MILNTIGIQNTPVLAKKMIISLEYNEKGVSEENF